MGYRFSWLAGIAGALLAFGRLEHLLRPSSDGLPWEVIVLAAAVLGGAITWAGLAYRLSTPAVIAINLAAILLMTTRIAVPATTRFVLPSLGSFPALGRELGYALDVIRSGVAPVLPLAGVIAIVAVVFWLLGALLAWGLARNRPYLALLTPLVLYLEFATMDRGQSVLWAAAFLLLLGLVLLAIALDRRRRGAGELTTGPGRSAVARTRPAPAVVAMAAVMLLALPSSTALARVLPRGGLLDWRVPSALAEGFYGSISYDPFISIRQQLVSPTNTVLFYAVLDGGLPAERVHFRLLTLEGFNGTQWYAQRRDAARPEEFPQLEDPGFSFRGPTVSVEQDITILALEQDWLPAAYSPTSLTSVNRAVEWGVRAKVNDGALHFDALTYYGMNYRVVSAVPVPDLAVLVLGEDGALSPLFAQAAAAEPDWETPAPTDPPPLHQLPDQEDYLRLPDGIDPGVGALARRLVSGLATDFEKGLALEAFFRSSGAFSYSLSVEPGHAATDLSAWLLDPESPNYRRGYCEQFATALAVMARQVGLPSRVVLGFTPGELLDDGRVVVRDRNAHAWVELWMSSQGWVRFDPTPRRDGVNPAYSDELPFDLSVYLDLDDPIRPVGPGSAPSQALPGDEFPPDIPPLLPVGTGDDTSWRFPAWGIAVAASLLLLLGLLPVFKWARRRHRLRALAAGDVSAGWREIVDWLSDLGQEPPPAATPAEVARTTDSAMGPLARAYGESIYGRRAGPGGRSESVTAATRALLATERALAERHSRARRVAARYRFRSLRLRRWPRR